MKSLVSPHDLKFYWIIRRAFLRIAFLLRKFFYNWRERIGTGGQATSIIFALIRNVWQVGITSVAVITLLQFTEHTLRRHQSLFFYYLPAWFLHLTHTLLDFVQLDKNAINQFLSTIAGVAGIFLGLYFAAISVVAGSMFANVPGVVREQLVREKAGTLYVKGLALLTSTSILLLWYQSIGHVPGVLNLLFVMGLCLFGALSFLLLGRRVFYFFDYNELARPIFVDLQHEILQVTTKGFAWSDENFQALHQKVASQHLGSLHVFVQTVLSLKEKEEEPLIKLVSKLIYLLSEYQKHKRRIPTDSKWYQYTPIHQNWFLAESSALTVALNTQVGIQPRLQPNLYWFEEELCRILSDATSKVLERERVQTLYRMLQPISDVLKTYGQEFAFEESEKVFTLISGQVASLTKNLDQKISNRFISNDYNLGMVDYHGYFLLNLVIGFFDSVRANGLPSFNKRLRKISWEDSKSIYSRGFSCPMLARLEFVQRTVRFEIDVEGISISPTWYRYQLVIMQYLHLLSVGIRKMMDLLKYEIVDVAKTYSDRHQFVFAAMHAQRGLEICEKIRYHLDQNKDQIESFNSVRTVHELPWPKWEWDKILGELRSSRENLIDILATCVPQLAVIDRPKDTPDVFGQSYNTVYAQAIFLLQRNRADEFINMFPSLFFGAMLAYDKLQAEEEIRKADRNSRLVFGSEPIIDMLDLSGYAKIYSELYFSPKMWDICLSTWNKYLDSHPRAMDLVKYIINIVQYRESLYSLIPRDVLRTNWELELKTILRKENLIDDMFERNTFQEDEPLVEHLSPFMRALCFHRYEPRISSVEVFILTYLLTRPEANGVEFRDNHDFRDCLTRESKRQMGDNTGGERTH